MDRGYTYKVRPTASLSGVLQLAIHPVAGRDVPRGPGCGLPGYPGGYVRGGAINSNPAVYEPGEHYDGPGDNLQLRRLGSEYARQLECMDLIPRSYDPAVHRIQLHE